MNKYFLKAGLLLALLVSAGSQASDVGISLQFGQPGFYGNVDIGNFQQPQLIYREPRIIERVVVNRAPLYLVVPPGHVKHWDKHCYQYDACGRQVYFVQERWYNDVVVPRYRDGSYHNYQAYQRQNERYEDRREERRDDRRDYRRDDRDDDHDHGRGRDEEHGHGHGKGHKDD